MRQLLLTARWAVGAAWSLWAAGTTGSALADEAPRPLYGAWGLDVAGMDRSVQPGDDFFRYANGAWLDRTPIAPDKHGVSLRLQMSDRVEARLREILETGAARAAHQPVDLEAKAGAFYKAFMDEERVEALSVRPIESQLEAVRLARTSAAQSRLMGRSNDDFESSVFVASIDVDLKDPAHYAVYLNQGGLGLPDRDYYLQAEFAKQKAAYEAYVVQLLQLLQWPDSATRAKEVVAFETSIAQSSWTREQDRDINAIYNPMSIAQLQQLAPGIAWQGFLASQRLSDVSRVVVAEKSAFPKIAEVFSRAPVETLQAWQAFHIADNAAPFLSKAFTDAWFEMHEKILNGQQQPSARWKRAILAVGGDDPFGSDRFGLFGTMNWGVGQLYSGRYFPPEAKIKITALVRNLVDAYRARLERLEWMNPVTRAEAIRKLNTYTVKVGYPDHPRDYAKLVILDDDLVGDVLRCASADWAFQVGRYHGPVDRSDWSMTPQTNDAYNGALRDIVFPAAILQPPIFDPDADPAINYGAVGGIIGHELTHGFDDQGRKIDAAGALRDWWLQPDAKQFETRAATLGRQYSQFQPLATDPALHVNPELTMGENIADLGGASLSLDAYHAFLGGRSAPILDGFTGDQRVFLGWAQAWRGKRTEDALKQQVVSDPHSPSPFRVNGVVRNMDAWYEAFGVMPADKLYLGAEERVHIW